MIIFPLTVLKLIRFILNIVNIRNILIVYLVCIFEIKDERVARSDFQTRPEQDPTRVRVSKIQFGLGSGRVGFGNED